MLILHANNEHKLIILWIYKISASHTRGDKHIRSKRTNRVVRNT